MSKAEAPLEVGGPWGCGNDMLGAGLSYQGIWGWCWVERWATGRWETEATPLDISEEEPLEVVYEATLDLVGERERMW